MSPTIDTERPWWKPSSLMIAFIIIAVLLIQGLFNTEKNSENIKLSSKVARIAAETAYHNCVDSKALIEWAAELSKIEKAQTTQLPYHQARLKAFTKLHDVIFKDDGFPCIVPALPRPGEGLTSDESSRNSKDAYNLATHPILKRSSSPRPNATGSPRP